MAGTSRLLRPSRASLVALSAIASLVASCTLTRTQVDNCTSNGDCRGAFGIGSVCGGDGICEKAPPNARCTQSFPEDLLVRPESYPNALVYGSLMDESVEAKRGRENGMRLAADQINEQGGLDGRPFGIVFCDIAADPKYDSLDKPTAAIESARYLADVVGAPALIGPSGSGDTLKVFDSVKDKDVLDISPAATSPELTTRDVVALATDERPGLLWRTAFPDTVQGAAIAQFLAKQTPPVTDVTVVFEQGAYGEGLEKVFRAKFPGRNIRSLSFASGVSSDRDDKILQAKSPKPQYVLFLSSQAADEAAFVNEVASLAEYDDIKLFLTDTAANTDLLKNTTGATAVYPRIVGSRAAVPKGDTFELFKASYIGAFKQDPSNLSFVPHAYDATWLVFAGSAYALRKEGHLSGTAIARGMRKVVSAGPEVAFKPVNWRQISDAIGAGTPINVVGASGHLDYDPGTEETTGAIDIWSIQAGAIVALETVEQK